MRVKENLLLVIWWWGEWGLEWGGGYIVGVDKGGDAKKSDWLVYSSKMWVNENLLLVFWWWGECGLEWSLVELRMGE